MTEQTWSPGPGTPVVEYRSGRTLFIGGLAMFVFFGFAALFPDIGTPSRTPRFDYAPGFGVFMMAAFSLGGLLLMVGTIPRTHRFAVDERGLWWRAGRKSDLIAWEELRAVRGQELRPPVKDDPNSKLLRPALVFTPVDRRFITHHRALLPGPLTPNPEVELRLPNSATVKQLTEAIARVRPDLLP
ncbi:hypothetical protein LZ318_07045 [Saccharopolyspora indica]|uniref:hypothetical protein n=1 Tax=Saccharopolyspora indica TaxID=1229659 RepID=UPI0022EB2963|nr:hypothetical protein [Saccharopolyspora indica]MDA3647904.1 hypothetical protein [Saccharopolyspora indica]